MNLFEHNTSIDKKSFPKTSQIQQLLTKVIYLRHGFLSTFMKTWTWELKFIFTVWLNLELKFKQLFVVLFLVSSKLHQRKKKETLNSFSIPQQQLYSTLVVTHKEGGRVFTFLHGLKNASQRLIELWKSPFTVSKRLLGIVSIKKLHEF